MIAASRSVLECRASEIMPIDPERKPAISLKKISRAFAAIENQAATDLAHVARAVASAVLPATSIAA
jgi:hypothetical protein